MMDEFSIRNWLKKEIEELETYEKHSKSWVACISTIAVLEGVLND